MDENVKNNQLSDEQLDNVSGGSDSDYPDYDWEKDWEEILNLGLVWDSDKEKWVEPIEPYWPEDGEGEPRA